MVPKFVAKTSYHGNPRVSLFNGPHPPKKIRPLLRTHSSLSLTDKAPITCPLKRGMKGAGGWEISNCCRINSGVPKSWLPFSSAWLEWNAAMWILKNQELLRGTILHHKKTLKRCLEKVSTKIFRILVLNPMVQSVNNHLRQIQETHKFLVDLGNKMS